MRISDWSSDVCSSDLHYTNRSVALFGQAGLKITDKLTANAGIRYTWDKVQACAGNSLVGALTVNECDRTAALNLPAGTGIVNTKGEYPNWTLGREYQATRRLFLLITSRRGIRGGKGNPPLF